jgi:hypothetical protein
MHSRGRHDDERHACQDHALRKSAGLRHACGVAATVLVLELALRRLNGQQYVRARQAEFAFFTPFIGAVLLPTLVAVAMLVVQARKTHSATLRPAVMAFALLLLALLVFLAVNGPINVEQLSWNMQAPPADWAQAQGGSRAEIRRRFVEAAIAGTQDHGHKIRIQPGLSTQRS